MIYLYDTGEQTLSLPRSLTRATGVMTLALRNTTTHKEYSFAELSDTSETQLLHEVSVVLPEDFQKGEWEYVLTDADGILAQGIAVYRTSSEPKEYNKVVTYEQYE